MDLLKWTEPQKPRTKQLIVAIDHGLSFPDMPGLEKPLTLLSKIAGSKEVDGLIAAPGIYRQADRHGISLAALSRLITVDYVAFDGNTLTEREIIISPDEAAAYQPHCYKMFFNMYDDVKELIRNIKDFSRFACGGQRLGVASLAEVLFHNNHRFLNKKTQAAELFKGCRCAMEAGADVLKIPLIDDTDALAEIIDRVGMPTYILGGSKVGDESAWQEQLRRMCALSIHGLMFGRNVWQSDDVESRIQKLANVIN